MKRTVSLMLSSSLLLAGTCILAAQEKPAGMSSPPKVLVIYREFVKPGKSGSVHEKAESAFVQAYTRAKSPSHYFAVDSMSGKPRSLFLYGYDSFDAWEKAGQASDKDATFSAANDRAAIADGDVLSDADSSVMVYREDQSLHANVDIPHMRYFEISLYHVRPGHGKEWDDLVKLVMAAYEKVPDTHWAMYEVMFGQQGHTYVVFSPRKSGAEIDEAFGKEKKFVEAMGEDGMKKLSELEASAVDSAQTNLFKFNPKMSYPPDAWVQADPEFWKPKP